MTDKQFSSLRTTIIGTAFFIGGAILSLTGEDFAVFIMIVGCILLLKDPVTGLWAQGETDNKAEEKEGRENDAYCRQKR